MNVLIVEDNPQNLKLFTVIIKAMKHSCLTAVDGEEGVQKAQQHNPDLILMDIQMPKKDGIAALRELRAERGTKDIPVVALTSYAMKGDRERFLAEGFDGYMEKPINSELFMAMIRKYEDLSK